MKDQLPVLCVILFAVMGLGVSKAADDPVNAIGDKIWGNTKKKITFMEGNVRLIQGSTVITTDKARVDSDKKLAFFENKVKLAHPDVTIEADDLEYNFRKKSGNFSKHIILNRAEVKDKEGKVTKDAFKLTTEALYFESDTKNFTAKSQAAVEHKDFTGTADLIEYNDLKQELFFKGNAYIRRPGGEEVWGDRITINTKSSNFVVHNQVKLNNTDVKIDADLLEYDYKKKSGTFSKNVTLTRIEEKDQKGKVTKDWFKLAVSELYFESGTKNFVTQQKGSVEHKDFTGTADRIEYSDTKQELVFKGNAKLKRPKGEEIHGDSIIIYIDDKSFVVHKNVKIDFQVEEDDEEGKLKK